MVLKRTLIVVSILLLVAMLGACVRSASQPPASVVTPPTTEAESQAGQEGAPAASGEGAESGAGEGAEAGATTGAGEGAEAGATGEMPSKGEPLPTNEVLQRLELFVTQTAAAAGITGQQPGAVSPEGTPLPPGTEAQQPGSEEQTGEQASSEGQPAEGEQTGEQPAGETSGSQEEGEQPTATEEPQSQPSSPTATEESQAQSPSSADSQPAAIKITPTPGIPSSYTLQPGEFVYCIARRFDVNPFELLSINGLSTSSVVRGGTTLRIPQTGNHFPGERSLKAHPTQYEVPGGENIYEIACKFGDVSPDMIALANGIKSPYTLTAGQVLNIP